MRNIPKTLRFFVLLFAAIIGFITAASAAPPSFDCTKATTLAENLICSNSQLSDADAKLALAYKQALSLAQDKDALKQEQINWIKNERDICGNTECLLKTYMTRISTLSIIGENTVEINHDLAVGECADTETMAQSVTVCRDSHGILRILPKELGEKARANRQNSMDIALVDDSSSAPSSGVQTPPHSGSIGGVQVTAKSEKAHTASNSSDTIAVLIVIGLPIAFFVFLYAWLKKVWGQHKRRASRGLPDLADNDTVNTDQSISRKNQIYKVSGACAGMHIFWGILLILMPFFFVFPYALIVFVPIFIPVFLSERAGVVVSVAENYLEYPKFWKRHRIPISAIDDINMEFAVSENKEWNGKRYVKSKSTRIYCANLSGEFGRDQIRFYEKGARDHFLSIMKKHSNARITRWS